MFLKYFFHRGINSQNGWTGAIALNGIFNKTALNVTVAEGFPAQNNA